MIRSMRHIGPACLNKGSSRPMIKSSGRLIKGITIRIAMIRSLMKLRVFFFFFLYFGPPN